MWEGYLQFGLADSRALLYFIFDLLLTTGVVWVTLRCFNTRHGWFGLSGLLAGLLLLILSSFWRFPGLHMLAQGLVVMLLVALPVLCKDDWIALFVDRNKTALPGASAGPALVVKSTGLIVLSVVFALVIVGLGTGIGTKTGELPQEIVISASNLPAGVSANFGSQTKVRAIVTAPRDQWQNLRTDVFSATVDVSSQGEGTYDLPIRLSSKLGNVTIVRTKPARVVVTVEPIIRKTVPVVVRFSGTAGNELVPDDPTIDPEKVEVAGPKSIVTDITQAIATIKLNGETKAIQQKASVVAQSASGDAITAVSFSPGEVGVTVPLTKAGKMKILGIRPNIVGQPASGLWVKSVTVTPATVAVTGSVDVLDAAKDLTTAALNLNNTSSDMESQVALSLPTGLITADGTQKVTVKIALDHTASTKTISPEIVYQNLAGFLQVTAINPTAISAVVSGSTDKLAALADGAVKVNIDLAAYRSADTYSVTITNGSFTLPDGISLVSLLPSALGVTLGNK